jgi:hypothetical protein
MEVAEVLYGSNDSFDQMDDLNATGYMNND